MRAVCLGLGRAEPRRLAHFAERGVQADLFRGLDAQALGLRTVNPYEVDAPGSGFNMGPKPTGIWIGHRMLWAALQLLPDDEVLVLEEDALFPRRRACRLGRALSRRMLH